MKDWDLKGNEPMSDAQRRLLNCACGDLAQMLWHGTRFDKDDYRHFLSGVVLGCRVVPSIDMGDGQHGYISMCRSSKDLTKTQATDAITMAFYIGDDPQSQGIDCDPVEWCDTVKLARGIRHADEQLAGRFK
jgi:hypothetical protein